MNGRAPTISLDQRQRRNHPVCRPNVLDGQVIGQCQQHDTHAEPLKLRKALVRETPKDTTLHVITDDYATHRHSAVQY